jgi:hypothetical protein
MNRRDFIGTVAGGLAAAKMGVGSLYGSAEQTSTAAQTAVAPGGPRQGAWTDRGVIDAGGLHEPYIFVVRRGGQPRDSRQHYEYEQSEKLIRQLKDQGVDVFHTHLYKGFGMKAEMPEMEDTIRTAEICHRLGMKIDTYVQWDTMMYETFFAEEPKAKNWIQCDQWGQPIMTEYGFQQSFRYRPCFSNQEFIDYLKKVVRFAVEKVKTDFIHFDNFDLSPEPDSCHCNGCKTGFRKYLNTKYSPQQRKERFGFENIEFVNPPLWNGSNRPENLNIIYDPVFQEWINYRCQSMADALGQMYDLIRSVNPEVAVEINFGGVVGHNNPWMRGNDHRCLLPYTQVFWDEQDRPPEVLPDGRLISTIRTYKMARHYRNVALTDAESGSGELGIGESLAFNQTLGFVGDNPLSAEAVKGIAFYRKNRDLYVGTEDVAPVAVLRSYPSITYHNSGPGLTAILVEQSLIQSRIPFQFAFDEDLKHLSPDRYKALVLPDSECLSDAELAAIHKYVQAGGGLVATGQSGLYDDWHRKRVHPGLQGLIDNQPAAAPYQEQAKWVPSMAGPAARKTVGRGRVVYLPGVEFDGPLPPREPYFVVGPPFWKRPKNWKQVVDAVTWASGGPMPLAVSGPEYVAANLVEQQQKRRRMVHLVNYNRQNPSVQNIQVKCELPEGSQVRDVRLYSIDQENGEQLQAQMQGRNAVFTVPKLNVYCMTVVSW